jgi:phage-related protein
MGLTEGILTALPILIEKLPEIIEKFINYFVNNLPKVIEMGIKITVELAKGLIKAIPQLVSKLPQIGMSIVNGIGKFVSNMGEVGANLIRGLWSGISNLTSWIIGKIRGFGSSVLKAIKGIFGVHSPSTEFYWIGKMNMVGFENAIDDMKPQIQKTIDSVFDLQPNVSGSMQSTYSPQMTVNVQNNMELDPLGQLVNNIKTFSGGAKNDYNWGASL